MTAAAARVLVSVVIPVRNGEAYLAAAIRSVLAQDYRPLELIVVDDGSTDRSREIASGFGEPVRVVSQAPGGAGAAVNHGVDLARGSLLAFLDADDLWLPGKLARQTEILRDDDRLDAVFGAARQFRGNDTEAALAETMAGYVRGTMLIRRTAYDLAGPCGTEWRLGEFIEWYARAVDTGLTSALMADVVLLRRIHDDNSGVRLRDEQPEYARVLKAVIDRRRASVPPA